MHNVSLRYADEKEKNRTTLIHKVCLTKEDREKLRNLRKAWVNTLHEVLPEDLFCCSPAKEKAMMKLPRPWK
jgi:hypothetical protein